MLDWHKTVELTVSMLVTVVEKRLTRFAPLGSTYFTLLFINQKENAINNLMQNLT